LRRRDDAKLLRQRLEAHPRRVLVIGGGFTGSEIASACCELCLPVTVTERGTAPLVGALGGVIAERVARLQRKAGVDLRCRVTVTSLEGDGHGQVHRAYLSDGSTIDAEVAVVALGAIRNTEWLRDSGLAAGTFGVGCDAGCRAFDINGIVTDDVFVAGDIARFPHPLYHYQFLSLEHWGNAVEQARVAAHNMICAPADRRPHVAVPAFWSSQFGVNIKSVGVPSAAEEVAIVQGSLDEASFVAAYGKAGQLVAAVAFNQAKWVEFYHHLIEQAAPFPPKLPGVDQPTSTASVKAAFPDRRVSSHDPNERRVQWIPRHRQPGTSDTHECFSEKGEPSCPRTQPSSDRSTIMPIVPTPTRSGKSFVRAQSAFRKMALMERIHTS
jgi:NADPH-dependent 2,4-dienoyl-CoA reductase/sulfur reductase-like enzyme